MRSSNRGIAAWIIAIVMAVVVTWIARGFYEDAFRPVNEFIVMNRTGSERFVELTFPSGEEHSFVLGRTNQLIRPIDIGEGVVRMVVDGKEQDAFGYVSTVNPAMMIIVMDSSSVMTMIPR